ncbi:MAG TPA: surface-adhesin E family protein [Gemmatimonadaceae bacterium]|nr:surface-adhesin E family protein [Gemmatimonadaceae bacterium]
MDTSLLQQRLGDDIRVIEVLCASGAELFVSARDLTRHVPVVRRAIDVELVVPAGDLTRHVPVVVRALDLHLDPTPEELHFFQLQAARSLGYRHSNIATAQPLQRRGNLVFYALNVGFATMLESVLGDGSQFSFEQSLGILRGIASGLDYAHAHGMVHGRLDPKLIFVDGDDVMISGFVAASDANAVCSIGSTTYAAPEQYAWRYEADARADVYALGVLAFELFSGKRVPDMPSADMSFGDWYTISRDVPLRSGVGLHVNEAISRAVSKRPSARFATAAEFIYALESPRLEPVTTAPEVAPPPRVAQLHAPLLPVAPEAVARPKHVASAIGIGAFCVIGAFTLLSMRKGDGVPDLSSTIAGTLSRLTSGTDAGDSSIVIAPPDTAPAHAKAGTASSRRRRNATAAVGVENGAISVPGEKGGDSLAARRRARAAGELASRGWMGITESPDFKIFADTGATVRQSSSVTKVWVRTQFANPQRISDNDSRKFVSSVNHYKLNCNAGTTSVGPGAFYDAAGSPIMSMSSGYTPLQQPSSGTPAEQILTRVCAVLRARQR